MINSLSSDLDDILITFFISIFLGDTSSRLLSRLVLSHIFLFVCCVEIRIKHSGLFLMTAFRKAESTLDILEDSFRINHL